MAIAKADPDAELQSVRERYDRRRPRDPRYDLLNPAALYAYQERQRAMLRLVAKFGVTDLSNIDLLEVGSGDGGNLLEWLRLGCSPRRVSGIELLHERHEAARTRLPAAVRLTLGDATAAPVEPSSCDIVLVSTVFSSVLDDAFQQCLADAMWRWVKPGGGVLWYDFTVNNPRNPDVRGVPLRRIRALFPQGRVHARRITLAPPIARTVTRLHPSLYTLFNTLPLLRMHALAWITKP
ncbi:MAG: class I SAM-dependent methyltransferase [Variovorax sp.]|nr:MAG: class I SAM-dependent methyltransferase [Variovorax sp.]